MLRVRSRRYPRLVASSDEQNAHSACARFTKCCSDNAESVTQKTRDELMKTRDSKNKDMEEQREKFTEEKRRTKLAFKDEMGLLRDNYLRKSQLREREMSDFIERTKEKMNDLELRLEEDKESLEKYYENKISKLKEGYEEEIRSLKERAD